MSKRGRKNKFIEQSKNVCYRVPVSQVSLIKKTVDKMLEPFLLVKDDV